MTICFDESLTNLAEDGDVGDDIDGRNIAGNHADALFLLFVHELNYFFDCILQATKRQTDCEHLKQTAKRRTLFYKYAA